MASILSYSTKQSKTALLKCSILLHTLEEYYCTGTSGILRNQELEIHVDLKTKLYLFTREDGSSRILRSLFCIPFRKVGPLLHVVVFCLRGFIVWFWREHEGDRDGVNK